MITVVSGLPRSGTSLMMQILEAGRMEILTDNIRKADESNPKGYYEYEKVKSLMKDNSWLSEAEGKAVKVIAQLIPFLPFNYEYKVVFMERKIEEIIHSQNKMIDKLGGKKATISQEVLKNTFISQVGKVKKILSDNPNFKVAFANYNLLVESGSEQIAGISKKLELNLNLQSVLDPIDKTLYRSNGEGL